MSAAGLNAVSRYFSSEPERGTPLTAEFANELSERVCLIKVGPNVGWY